MAEVNWLESPGLMSFVRLDGVPAGGSSSADMVMFPAAVTVDPGDIGEYRVVDGVAHGRELDGEAARGGDADGDAADDLGGFGGQRRRTRVNDRIGDVCLDGVLDHVRGKGHPPAPPPEAATPTARLSISDESWAVMETDPSH